MILRWLYDYYKMILRWSYDGLRIPNLNRSVFVPTEGAALPRDEEKRKKIKIKTKNLKIQDKDRSLKARMTERR